MSKTQLQSNNSKLSDLITELQSKAAGSGSGGSAETCTVTCNVALSSPYMEPINIYYIDELGEPQNVDFTLVETITI